MKKLLILRVFAATLVLFGLPTNAVELDYYLPEHKTYDQKIPTPESVIGFQVGEWHVRPELVERYFRELAETSPRVKLEVIGYTYEKRPLLLAYISSPENIARLEQIRQDHVALKNQENTPVVTWMGYSVHGNEASGSNSSLLFAYHLAAAQDEATLKKLNDQVIIVDPMLNPDGLARFASWVNSYKSAVPNPDPKDMEHNEIWPRGRTNHYWFDLNRDWLLLQHPESRARVSKFQQWRPHILTDFHEMGTNSTYFFQPGVPSRQNPLTSENNFKMTGKIAEYHAKALDDIGSLYYSKESFDDFYYGKGSTYPDIHGTVGILFEQASARGHAQEGKYGMVSFPFAIKNHLTTSFSTVEAAQQNQPALKKLQADFSRTSREEAKKDRNRAVVVSSHDPYRLNAMSELLKGHQITHYPLAKNLKLKSGTYRATESLIIPLQQKQYRLINAMFETRSEFEDKIFYDVSAWNLALAFDLDYAFVSRSDYDSSLQGQFTQVNADVAALTDKQTIALAFDWNNFNSVRLLSQMLQQELLVQTVTKPTKLVTADGETSIPLGSIILTLNGQSKSRAEIIDWLTPHLLDMQLTPIAIRSGYALSGTDMGSPSNPIIEPIKPVMLVGNGVSSYSAGEIWHLLDQRLSQPVTMMTARQFNKLNTINYTHLILADGSVGLSKEQTEKVAAWVKEGGVIIAHSRAAKWLTKQGWTSSKVKEFDKPVDTKVAYSEKGQVDAAHYIGGAIAKATIDTSHPLAFGLDNKSLAIFKRGQQVFTEPKEAFVSIARFNQEPLASGYISQENLENMADGTAIMVQALGRGRLIAFSDNPVFRGYWLGTSRVFTNALYFAKAIRAPAKTKDKKADKKPEGLVEE